MQIKSQTKTGIIMNALKSWEELADDEREAVTFRSGESKEDYRCYQVRRNSKNELLGVRPYFYTEAKSKAIDEAGRGGQNFLDLMQVQFGRGKEKAEAKRRLERQGVKADLITRPVSKGNLLDTYLSHFDLTRYAVAQKTGIGQSTLQKAAATNTANGLSVKVIASIAMAIGTDPGRVVNDLITLEAQRDTAQGTATAAAVAGIR